MQRSTRPPALYRRKSRQSGVTAVELALIVVFAFFPLLLGILEVSRLFYVADMAQEVTRRAARHQVVRWMSQTPAIQRDAVFQCGSSLAGATLACQSSGTVSLPGGMEIRNSDVRISFHNTYADASNLASTGISGVSNPQANLNNCLLADPNCIQFVRASLQGVSYQPMVGWFGNLFQLPLPGATVIMPAEGLGLL
jgi:hypothetical protein